MSSGRHLRSTSKTQGLATGNSGQTKDNKTSTADADSCASAAPLPFCSRRSPRLLNKLNANASAGENNTGIASTSNIDQRSPRQEENGKPKSTGKRKGSARARARANANANAKKTAVKDQEDIQEEEEEEEEDPAFVRVTRSASKKKKALARAHNYADNKSEVAAASLAVHSDGDGDGDGDDMYRVDMDFSGAEQQRQHPFIDLNNPPAYDQNDEETELGAEAAVARRDKGKGKYIARDNNGDEGVAVFVPGESSSRVAAPHSQNDDEDVPDALAHNLIDLNIVPTDVEDVVMEDVVRQNRDKVTSERRKSFQRVARANARRFAWYDDGDSEQNFFAENVNVNAFENDDYEDEDSDWPGPFSTARRLVAGRFKALAERRQGNSCKGGDGENVTVIDWKPSRGNDSSSSLPKTRSPPSLYDLCLKLLTTYAEDIESLEGIPDASRAKIAALFCAQRVLNPRTLRLFVTGAPSEIHVADGSQIPEEHLINLLAECSSSRLEVLNLQLCGRAISDQLFLSVSVDFPKLTSVSLKGAYRLSDTGLKTLVQKSPHLTSIDLTSCSYLSNYSVEILADNLSHVIKELRLSECKQLNARRILPSLEKLEKLEVISLSGIESVTDDFLREFLSFTGCQLKELYLEDCSGLTDGALQAIGAVCCSLNTLFLDNLTSLTDITLACLTDGCRSLKTFSCRRCLFSDEAVATYISGAGSSLSDVSLNGVKQVSNQTILALVKSSSKTLCKLDVSFCRNLTDQALGLLADSCKHLQQLVIYGNTQITETFLNGHSNPFLIVTR